MSFHSATRLVASLLLVTAPIFAMSAPASAYERVTMYNLTKNTVTGTIHYRACKTDSFTIPPATTGKVVNQFVTTNPTQVTISAYRGGCLISRIEAKSGDLAITPYTSTALLGSTKSKFMVIGFPPNANGMTGAVTAGSP